MSATPGSQKCDDPFTRRIIHDGERSLIEARCTRCGAVIIGSVTEHLVNDERAHLELCPNHQQH
jgi:hypothetical protein